MSEFEIRDPEINIEEIMEQIRENIKKRGYIEEELPTLEQMAINNVGVSEEYSLQGIQEQIILLNQTWNIQAYRPLTSHRGLIGKPIVFFKKVIRKIIKWYIEPIVDEQTVFNANVTNVCNNLQHYINHQNEMNLQENDYITKLKEYIQIHEEKNQEEDINKLKNIKDLHDRLVKAEEHILELEKTTELQDRLLKAEEHIEKLEKATDLQERLLKTQIAQLEKATDLHAPLLRVEENIRALNTEVKKINLFNAVINQKISRTERGLRIAHNNVDITQSEEDIREKTKNNDEEEFNIDYLIFEEIYRGSEELIKQRQESYISYFENKDNIIDIGCGRGEFLKLLINEGKKSVKGFDLNRDMVQKCQDEGLEVKFQDGVEYLYRNSNLKLGGVFSAQVVEHLTQEQLVKLIRGAYQNLEAGGILLIETINPQALCTFGSSYTLDPSHKLPVHPFTLKFIMESEGFKEPEIMYTNKVEFNIPKLESDEIQGLEEFNNALEELKNTVFGYQDYAIIARK